MCLPEAIQQETKAGQNWNSVFWRAIPLYLLRALLESGFLSPTSHLLLPLWGWFAHHQFSKGRNWGSEKPREEFKMTASKRLSLSWSCFPYPCLPLLSKLIENNGGTTLLSRRAGGRRRVHPPGPPENAPGLFTRRVTWGPGEVSLLCDLVVLPSALEQLVHLLDLGVGWWNSSLQILCSEQFAFHN